MTGSKHRLSKTRLMSYLQCPKRLWLEAHRPELVEYSKATEAAFATGHEIGDIARQIYGQGGGVLIGLERGLGAAIRQTRAVLRKGSGEPVFEATFRYEGVLIRADVLLPGEGSCRAVEVKASTSVKEQYVADCAIQSWVMEGDGLELGGIALAHVDNAFVYPGEGDYGGLLREEDLSEAVAAIKPEVPGWVADARHTLSGPEPQVPVGRQCSAPYDCPLFNHCWPSDAEFPVYGLKGGKARLAEWVNHGYRDIRDVPAQSLSSAAHRRIHRITSEAEPELLPGARVFAEALGFPRYYLDFETIGPAVPLWPHTRPYETLPIQWSCHIEDEPGAMRHQEFLDLSGEPPMRPLADSLIAALGSDGPILMYTGYERRVIEGLADRFPDLATPLGGLLDRLVDLHPVARANYYHPAMLGSWSIKALLPTVAPDLDYGRLEEIQEGTAASAAYLEAISPDTTAERRRELESRMLAYCRFDTEAMVRLTHFFACGGEPKGR